MSNATLDKDTLTKAPDNARMTISKSTVTFFGTVDYGYRRKKRVISFENRYSKILNTNSVKLFYTLYTQNFYKTFMHRLCVLLFNVLYNLLATSTVDNMYEIVDISKSFVPK